MKSKQTEKGETLNHTRGGRTAVLEIGPPPADAPAHPGRTLYLGFLRPRNIGQRQLAERIGVAPTLINQIISGERNITPQLALRLASAIGPNPEYWLMLQMQYDLSRTREALEPDLRQIKPFPLV